MDLHRILDRLDVAAGHGVELSPEQKKARETLSLFRRVSEGLASLDAPIAQAHAAEAAARQLREQSATTTFPGEPRADDDLVVMGARSLTFRILHCPDGSLRFCESGAFVEVPDRTYPAVMVRRSVADGESFQGHTVRVYQFSEHRSVSYVPAKIWAALPPRTQDRIGARQSAPSDLWDWSGGPGAHLPFNRGRSIDGRAGQPSEAELTAATAAAISQCRTLVAGCFDVSLLRAWRDNSGRAGEAAGVLHSVISRRLSELGADAAQAEPDEPEAA